MFRRLILFFLIILFLKSGFAQNPTYYHNFRPTDSHIILTSWRVDFNDIGDYYIIESIDVLNRVTELRLMHNDKLYESDCYDVSIIRFEYKQDTIIQYNMINDSLFSAGIECGDPAKLIYVLQGNDIIKCISYTDYDIYLKGNFDLEEDFRIQLENEKEKCKNGKTEDHSIVWGYYFSSTKYNGKLPTKKDVTLEGFYLPYSEKAKESQFAIQNCERLDE